MIVIPDYLRDILVTDLIDSHYADYSNKTWHEALKEFLDENNIFTEIPVNFYIGALFPSIIYCKNNEQLIKLILKFG